MMTVNPHHHRVRPPYDTSASHMLADIGEEETYDVAEQLGKRRKYLAPSFSTHYKSPLMIRRGRGTFLFDHRGQAFLDCVNNPAGVGHCHPLVVAAASDQMAKLNTNTRYVFPELNEYAERLCKTLPAPLCCCFFVNSGSEANDLALRIARWHTQQQDVICLQGGYHGHTEAVIDVSPYKYSKALGRSVPETTHEVPAPDVYRHGDKGGGEAMALDVKRAVEKITAQGRRPALFICEGALSCAGYIPLPDGYLRSAYEHVRAEGGLCLSDEVQSGFGRVGGGMMWAFERAGVSPDIVTMGKPMGNGFPLAAVITTKELAESFAKCGMEYFNTFGGGPVSMRVGNSVLDAMEKDSILQNVDAVSCHLLDGLRALQAAYPVIGDVRGHGLFLGVELVRDRVSKEPAAMEADWVCEALRNRGVLLNTDGVYGNVFKMKPPLCISIAHADLLITTLHEVLSQMPSDLEGFLTPQQEVPSALARVNAVVEQFGVGAGPSWQHCEGKEDQVYSVSLSVTPPTMGLVLGVLVGLVIGIAVSRRA